MQPNLITLNVDTDNDGGTTAAVTKTYSRFEEYLNRSEYIMEGHSLALRDKMGLYRTMPKQAGNFRGMAKTSVKFTKDLSVPGVDATTSIVAPEIIDIGFSFPVGTTPAQSLELRMTAVAMLLNDDVMVMLNDTLMV